MDAPLRSAAAEMSMVRLHTNGAITRWLNSRSYVYTKVRIRKKMNACISFQLDLLNASFIELGSQ